MWDAYGLGNFKEKTEMVFPTSADTGSSVTRPNPEGSGW